MQCELCGIESSDCSSALVDGVRMMLCPRCMRHGDSIKIAVSDSSIDVQKSLIQRARKTKVKDVYAKMDRELVSGWAELIKQGRTKKGLTREELGFRIGERTVTIAKIENGDLRPSDKTAEKLEKELDISLFEEVRDISAISSSTSSRGLTLGDFIKTEKK